MRCYSTLTNFVCVCNKWVQSLVGLRAVHCRRIGGIGIIISLQEGIVFGRPYKAYMSPRPPCFAARQQISSSSFSEATAHLATPPCQAPGPTPPHHESGITPDGRLKDSVFLDILKGREKPVCVHLQPDKRHAPEHERTLSIGLRRLIP